MFELNPRQVEFLLANAAEWLNRRHSSDSVCLYHGLISILNPLLLARQLGTE